MPPASAEPRYADSLHEGASLVEVLEASQYRAAHLPGAVTSRLGS
jgi:hypothetical protein